MGLAIGLAVERARPCPARPLTPFRPNVVCGIQTPADSLFSRTGPEGERDRSAREATRPSPSPLVLVTSVLSIGQVQYEREQRASRANGDAGLVPGELETSDDTPSDAPTAGPAASAAAAASASASAAAAAGRTPGGTTSGRTPAGSVPTAKPAGGGAVGVPDFGLKTQGVTDTTVKIGIDYNKSGCGGSGALEAALGPAVTSATRRRRSTRSPATSTTPAACAAARCRSSPSTTAGSTALSATGSAAIEMVDEHKVFIDDRRPARGRRRRAQAAHPDLRRAQRRKAEQKQRGIGQFQIFQDADADFANWASFGKHYLGTNTSDRRACFVHPDTADFNNLEKILVDKMKRLRPRIRRHDPLRRRRRRPRSSRPPPAVDPDEGQVQAGLASSPTTRSR